MSKRATIFGTGQPGGEIEYKGDLTPPVSSYASVLTGSNIADGLRVPASTAWTRSAVVTRNLRRGGHRFFYSHGAVPMRVALPEGGVAAGGVESSRFQRFNVQLMDWQINASWYEAGYPRNLGLSTRVPQLVTNVTGGPGKSASDQRPIFTKVQTIPRARALIRTYPTKSAKG